jgi:hypothetical protein
MRIGFAVDWMEYQMGDYLASGVGKYTPEESSST